MTSGINARHHHLISPDRDPSAVYFSLREGRDRGAVENRHLTRLKIQQATAGAAGIDRGLLIQIDHAAALGRTQADRPVGLPAHRATGRTDQINLPLGSHGPPARQVDRPAHQRQPLGRSHHQASQ